MDYHLGVESDQLISRLRCLQSRNVNASSRFAVLIRIHSFQKSNRDELCPVLLLISAKRLRIMM